VNRWYAEGAGQAAADVAVSRGCAGNVVGFAVAGGGGGGGGGSGGDVGSALVLVIARFQQQGMAAADDVEVRIAAGIPLASKLCHVAVERVTVGAGGASARNATTPVQVSSGQVAVQLGGTVALNLTAVPLRDAFRVVVSQFV
jgi:hypothetical protein